MDNKVFEASFGSEVENLFLFKSKVIFEEFYCYYEYGPAPTFFIFDFLEIKIS